MPQILFANNAATTLATAISSVATSLTVTSGGGALFPNPGTNQYFLATLSPVTPGAQPQEIVRVTARSTNTFTITRGQEGTTAQAWGTGAIVQNLLTAATVGAFPQTIPFAGNPNGSVSGAAGAGNLPPSTVWDYTNNLLYVCITSGTTSTAQWAAQAPLTSPAFNGSPTAPNVAFGDNSFLLANTAFVANGLAPKSDYTYVNAQLATRAVVNGSSAQQFNVANATTGNNAVNLGQFGSSLVGSGYQLFPGGLILQWGNIGLNYTTPGSVQQFTVALPRSFNTVGLAFSATFGANPPTSGSIGINASGASNVLIGLNVPAASTYGINFIAIGV